MILALGNGSGASAVAIREATQGMGWTSKKWQIFMMFVQGSTCLNTSSNKGYGIMYIYIFTYTYMGGDFKYSGFSPYLEKIPILNDIFQWGWNHQLDIYTYITIYIYTLPKVNTTSLTSSGSATVNLRSNLYHPKSTLRFWQVLFQRCKRLGQVEWSCMVEAEL